MPQKFNDRTNRDPRPESGKRGADGPAIGERGKDTQRHRRRAQDTNYTGPERRIAN